MRIRALTVLFVAASGAVLAACTALAAGNAGAGSTVGVERYCGIGVFHVDVYALGGVPCAVARGTFLKMSKLPPDGNAPGSPDGWSCYRMTGTVYGDACQNKTGQTIETFGATDGSAGDGKPQHGHCPGGQADTQLRVNDSQAVYSVNGINCSYVYQVLLDWNENNHGVGAGPVAFHCARNTSKKTATAKTVCGRNGRSFIFGVAGTAP